MGRVMGNLASHGTPREIAHGTAYGTFDIYGVAHGTTQKQYHRTSFGTPYGLSHGSCWFTLVDRSDLLYGILVCVMVASSDIRRNSSFPERVR